MATHSTKYLIIGGGLAAASALEELVKLDGSAKGATIVLTTEAELPYHRPPLSKGMLLGKETLQDALVQPAAFYADNGIEVWNRRKARLIDVAGRVCELQLNSSIKFEKALIATGASPNRFDGSGRSLENVHYLRTVQDSMRIREAMGRINEAVIVGGSFIGMEVASAFAQNDIRATVINRAPLPWNTLGNPEVSRFFKSYFERKGVRFMMDDEPANMIGTNSVGTVYTKSGKKLNCDAVIMGIGVHPNDELAGESRLEADNGIIVDEKLCTRIPGIYAAGDVARFTNPKTGKSQRIEHWDNAQKQGTTAGRNLAGHNESYDAVPMFFSDVFDLSFELWGQPEEPDQVIQRFAPSKDGICSFYVKDDTLQAVLLMGRPPEESEIVEKAVGQRVSIAGKYDILRSEKRELSDLLQ